jgi:3-methyladenine DNA glycosylase AlkD
VTSLSVAMAAKRTGRSLAALARPTGEFNPSRYFRSTETLGFLNVRMPVVRQLAKSVARANREQWTVHDAAMFADTLIRDDRLEVKAAGIETLACFHRQFDASLLAFAKRWLAQNFCANWATTDSLCGSVIAPLLLRFPALISRVTLWVNHRNMWVRRASAVSLVRLAGRGLALDEAYQVVDALASDPNDLIHKATGWLLRQAGRTDRPRLARYLRANGPALDRTTVRYAIEHFPEADRRRLLDVTRGDGLRRHPKRAPGRSGSGEDRV